MRKAKVGVLALAGISATTLLTIRNANAMAGEYGKSDPKHPISVSTWPKGLAAVANRADRIGGYWVNSSDTFYYAGNTADFSNFLQQYSKVRSKSLTLIIDNSRDHSGPFQPTDSNAEWQMGCSGWSTATASVTMPLHGRIALKEIKVPLNVDIYLVGMKDIDAESFVFMHKAQQARSSQPTNEEDPRIGAFVASLAREGILLQHKSGPKERGKWYVAGVVSDPYTFIVYLRSFRASATDAQMDEEARNIQLAFRLNRAAHLGMSLSATTHKAKKLPDRWQDLPMVRKLNQLFDAYRPVAPSTH